MLPGFFVLAAEKIYPRKMVRGRPRPQCEPEARVPPPFSSSRGGGNAMIVNYEIASRRPRSNEFFPYGDFQLSAFRRPPAHPCYAASASATLFSLRQDKKNREAWLPGIH
jgi:hypothetical protein